MPCSTQPTLPRGQAARAPSQAILSGPHENRISETVAIRSRYLDASAAVKLVVNEIGSVALREYFEGGDPFYITSPCALEVFSVLKVKHFYRKELSREEYFSASYAFSAYLRDAICVERFDFHTPAVFFEVEEVARRHNFDLVDAIQLYTLLRGRFANYAGQHKSLLITADENLAAAARIEGIEVWDCTQESPPAR